MGYFVNLPLSWILADGQWLEWFIAEGLSPEFGFDEAGVEQPLPWHQGIGERLRAAGLSCSVHLPFMRLRPGSPDAAELRFTRERLNRAAELSRVYGAAHMVGHPAYIAERDGEAGSAETPERGWLERFCETWRPLPELGGCPLFLENIRDQSPRLLPGLVKALNLPPAQVGICFDAGHWHAFAGGKKKQDLPEWVKAHAPYIRHLHLHDNDGSDDQHLGLGKGDLPFELLLSELDAHGLRPSVTFEPHSGENFMDTAAWFAARPKAAAQIGWVAPKGSGLPIPPENEMQVF